MSKPSRFSQGIPRRTMKKKTQDGCAPEIRNRSCAKIREELNTLIQKSKSQWKYDVLRV
jgi:hypothetical protein